MSTHCCARNCTSRTTRSAMYLGMSFSDIRIVSSLLIDTRSPTKWRRNVVLCSFQFRQYNQCVYTSDKSAGNITVIYHARRRPISSEQLNIFGMLFRSIVRRRPAANTDHENMDLMESCHGKTLAPFWLYVYSSNSTLSTRQRV